MSTCEISEDEDTFEEALNSNQYISESSIMISSDDNSMDASNLKDSDSSDCEVDHLNVNLKKTRSAVIKRLFPFSTNKNNLKNDVNNGNVQKVTHMSPPKHVDDIKNAASVSKPFIPVEKTPGVNKMIGGVSVNMPVEPYGCQLALMSKVITAIKTSQNCLLESPTGTGKTLALLCSALAWQRSEKIKAV